MSELSAGPSADALAAPQASDTLPARALISPAEIEERQDELLRQLDELEKRIARVLAEYAVTAHSGVASLGAGAALTTPAVLPLSIPAVPSAAVVAAG
ncbi:MAG TPA: hypothetical protein VMF30_05055 [Pirellulales bacterium]|nr:hypothetical protein [Pirellulales bacterium]